MGSVTTKLRMIRNSSLDNKNNGLSFNDYLLNSLFPVHCCLALLPVKMIKKTYVDDCSGGRSKDTVDRMVEKEVTDTKGHVIYTANISQIFPLGRFNLEAMVPDGEARSEITKCLGGGVLELSWVPNKPSSCIWFHISQNKANVGLGPELTINIIYKLYSIAASGCPKLTPSATLWGFYSDHHLLQVGVTEDLRTEVWLGWCSRQYLP